MERNEVVGLVVIAILAAGLVAGLAHTLTVKPRGGWAAFPFHMYGRGRLLEHKEHVIGEGRELRVRLSGGGLEVFFNTTNRVSWNVYEERVTLFPGFFTSQAEWNMSMTNKSVDMRFNDVYVELALPTNASLVSIDVSGGYLVVKGRLSSSALNLHLSGGYSEVSFSQLNTTEISIDISGGSGKLDLGRLVSGAGATVDVEVSGGYLEVSLGLSRGAGLTVHRTVSGGYASVKLNGEDVSGGVPGTPLVTVVIHISGGYAEVRVSRD